MKFSVDPPELHKVSTKLNDLSNEYEEVYKSLLNSASTMGEAYKAQDNLAFVDQINGFSEELKAMTEHMRQCSQAMEQIAKNYEVTSENNTASVKRLAN